MGQASRFVLNVCKRGLAFQLGGCTIIAGKYSSDITTVSLSNLSSGFYLIHLYDSKDGLMLTEVKTEKIIVN
jgi:hypothetical protein